ncbi:HAMP domain-containing sensor histidine kinase [Metabacillus arenae]|uniref:histidine kinase n=1 Tax=Metabacillus arenae TaxID=2771434 RepID=A0A926NEG8_9BACI|nr:ATP-binding protein [Metabacillus arenae]MBD1382004.1 ATP-binding protein [Metabacillus arenae]
MKIKWIFLIANSVSVLIMFTFLFVSYMYMVLPNHIIIWLSIITIFSSLLSSFVHYLLTKPVERSIQLLVKQSHQMEKGKFDHSLPVEGPAEIKELTIRFNHMNVRLNDAFNQIKQAETRRRELVANISHDLRTPMSSIKAFVAAIQDGVVEDDATFHRYLRTIGLETERLDQLIQQLFQLSLLDSGGIRLSYEPIRVDELLLAVLEHEQIHLEQKNIEIDVKLPNQIPSIHVDRLYFQKVLFNLLDNAIRFSEEGGLITLSVVTLPNQKIKVSIRDRGEGISKEELPHIFERTYRIEKSRNKKFGGAGLGLAIAKTIVEKHNGVITAGSEVGKGSEFMIVLPINRNEVEEKSEFEDFISR